MSNSCDKALYVPFRVLGQVTSELPFALNRLGDEYFLTVSIGKSFQIFRTDRLAVCLVSKPVPAGEISLIQVHNHETYVVAQERFIYKYRRTSIIKTIDAGQGCNIKGMLIVGDILLYYDCNNHVKVNDFPAT